MQGEDKTMKISAIIATRNNFQNTRLCLQALRMSQNVTLQEIIIVDNGSQDGTREWLRKQSDLRVFMDHTTTGLAAAWNIGAKAATGDLLLFLHNDVFVTEHTIQQMCKALETSDDGGAAGAFTNRWRYRAPYYLHQDYQDFDELQRAVAYEESIIPLRTHTMILESHCLLMRKSVYEEIGDFDEQFDLVGFEDVDYSFRLQQHGYKLYIAGTYAYHDQSSFASNHLEQEAVHRQQHAKFVQKWGTDPRYSTNIRKEFLSEMNLKKENLAVLEVGCACGGNLMTIAAMNPEADLYGIEINPQTARVASCYAQVEAEDVETISRNDWQGKFDYIIAGDVIEHLRDPWKAVKNIGRLLKPEGKLFISVPNVLFIGNMYNMLQGEWRYMDAGILDRTHLRFFTRQSIVELVQEAALTVDSIWENKVGLPEYIQTFNENLVAVPGVRVDQDELEVYQWLLVVSISH